MTRTATSGGTLESGAGELSGDMTAGGSDTGKATSAAANKVGSGGHHGARSGVRDRIAGWQENPAGESSGVGGEEEGRKASRVASESLGVGGQEAGRKAYRVAENPGRDLQLVQGGVELPQGIDTLGLADSPREGKTPGMATEG